VGKTKKTGNFKKIKKMKSNQLLFVLLLFIQPFSHLVSAQTIGNSDVGVFEHLGQTIPLSLKFVNEKDSLVSLQSLVNKPTVLSFVYFDCPGLCSPLLDGISEAIDKSDLQLGKDYQVITVSFNIHDTPEKARQKKKTFLGRHSKSHAASWIYLTGDSTNIYKLSDAVGFKFKRVGNDFIHPAVIMVLSPKGVITRYLYGVRFPALDYKLAILEARKGLSRSTVNRVLTFCYAYDPNGKKYVLSITKVAGASVALLFLIIILGFVWVVRRNRKNTVIAQPYKSS
jgi:protein SCO1/2